MRQTREVLSEHLAGCSVVDSSVWSLAIIAVEVIRQATEVRVVSCRRQGGHVEPAPQPCASALGEVFAFPGSELPRHRCDPSQTGHLPGFQSSDLGQLREESGRCRPRDSRNRGQDPVDPCQFRIGLDQSRDFCFQSGPFAFDLAKSISGLTLEKLGVKLRQPVFYDGAFLHPAPAG